MAAVTSQRKVGDIAYYSDERRNARQQQPAHISQEESTLLYGRDSGPTHRRSGGPPASPFCVRGSSARRTSEISVRPRPMVEISVEEAQSPQTNPSYLQAVLLRSLRTPHHFFLFLFSSPTPSCCLRRQQSNDTLQGPVQVVRC